MLTNTVIYFAAPNTVQLREEPLDPDEMGSHEVLIESLYSLISAGTELACLSGEEFWFPLPGDTGYCNVGRVVAAGEDVEGFAPGDVVLNYGKHQRYNCIADDKFLLKPPEWIDLRLVPLTRLATVAFTALRVSNIELGDDVGVVGLGLVGNLAAQLAGLQGGRVIGIGHRDGRIELARTCGIDHTINSHVEDVKARVKELTNGAGVRTLIDSTGSPQTIAEGLDWIAQMGELVLLAESRGRSEAQVGDVFNHVFMYGWGSISIKGAHEWQFPTMHSPYVKHSFERNSQLVWQLCHEGRLKLDELISHVVRPEEAPEAYEALRTKQPDYMGVLFDWDAMGD
jgi:2-desacetyl-2-hydroxyethyl bacteriochlorophyllide A dehydrogenase